MACLELQHPKLWKASAKHVRHGCRHVTFAVSCGNLAWDQGSPLHGPTAWAWALGPMLPRVRARLQRTGRPFDGLRCHGLAIARGRQEYGARSSSGPACTLYHKHNSDKTKVLYVNCIFPDLWVSIFTRQQNMIQCQAERSSLVGAWKTQGRP